MTQKTINLSEYKPAITDYLNNFLNQEKNQLAKISLDDDIFNTLNSFLSRGKMARGNLLILTYESFNNNVDDDCFHQVLLAMASALELIQAALLVHDDIIDQDEQRRGQNSIWQHYALQSPKNNRHYGLSQAICLGDLCFFLANQLIVQACANLKSTKKATKTKALDIQTLINREISQVIMAEMLDVELAMKSRVPSLKQILKMNLYKTARYSFSLPLMLAGYLADQSPANIKQISKIGEKIGLIFQIQDDYLGIFGKNKNTGKPILSDVREGKKTIFYYYLMRSKALTSQERKLVVDCFGKKHLEKEQVEALKNYFKNHSLQQVNKKFSQLKQEAQKQIYNLENKKLKILLEKILFLAQNRHG